MRLVILPWLFASLAFLSVSVGVVYADENEPFVEIIEVQGSLVLSSTEDKELVLKLVGPISSSMIFDFLNITRNRDVDLVALNSPGGDLDAGIAISEYVSSRNMDTWVSPESSCASACSLIFFAGQERLLEGRLGVHQYQTIAGQADDESAAQERLGRLIELLNSFDTPPMAIEKLAVTKPSCMYWFGREHLAMMVRGAEDSIERIEGSLECTEVQRVDPNLAVPSVLAPEPQKPDVSFREVRQMVQVQLNRLGCNVGAADGIIGPRSRAGLESFSKARGIPFDIQNFDSLTFHQDLTALSSRICAAAQTPTSPNLAGSWFLSARCSFTTTAIRGNFTARRTSEGRYSLIYRNNLGETASGTIFQNGKRASVSVAWSTGGRTTSHMTLNSAGNRMSGRSNNGCVFEAWR